MIYWRAVKRLVLLISNPLSCRMPRHIRDFLRLTSSKFETELAKRAPRNRENGLKITRGVHVFLIFTKKRKTFNKPLLTYWFWRGEIIEASYTFTVALGRLKDISKRVLKLAFLHVCLHGKKPFAYLWT